jgi:hypothetical protein
LPIQRFNWDEWDVVTDDSGTPQGDIHRTDYTYPCASEIPGVSASPSGNPTPTPGLSGCQRFMPPRIDDIRIVPSSIVELYIYGDGIRK